MNKFTNAMGKFALAGFLMASSVFASDGVESLEATRTKSDYFWKFRPLKKDEVKKNEKAVDPRIVFRFFEEDYTPGGFDYYYPDASKVNVPEESGYESEVAIEFDLVASDYSGGAVVLYNMLYNMDAYVAKGALEFWIKGERGGEIATIGLTDDEARDGVKTVVRLPINNYGGIKKEWQKISIPLADFGLRGVFWDAKKRVEVPYKFDWDAVCEFRIEIKKGDNEAFKVWVDDVFVKRDIYDEKVLVYEETWAEQFGKDIIPAPPIEKTPDVKKLFKIIDNDVPKGGFAYTYGGKTDWAIQETDKPGVKVLASYPDNSDYSGVTLSMGAGNGINLVKYRRKYDGKYAGIGFWLKAAPNVKSIYFGVMDDESDGYKTQTKLTLGDYGTIDTTWNYFMIPVKAFNTQGLYWDAEKKAEISAPVLWENIEEFRLSTSKYENKVGDNDPVPFYIADLAVIDNMPGYVDKEEFWTNFKSDLPDEMILDMEGDLHQKWEASHGPKSKMDWKIVDSEKKELGKKSVEFSFKMADWSDGIYSFQKNNFADAKRDWTKHWGLRFWIYTDKPYQSLTVQIGDAGSELWVANTGGTRGWNEVLVPFKNFFKFPYYQPPHAIQNGNFDLDKVVDIDFKPAGEGSIGTFRIDNIQLTNIKELEKAPVAEEINVAVNANYNKTIQSRINDGIFGINVALWDGDLLNDQTIKYVKDVDHGVLRYPGGLRADEDHWFEVLDKKDWMVDTDEMVEFAKKTGTTLMITVNGGRGNAEQAAAWVEHVNIKNKANIKYWEIGNELYGNWHPNMMTGEAYGKMCKDYVQKMKAVDPTIIITAVWTLEGPWNEAVFKECGDVVDGVNVHHYPQHYGEENDVALLDAPNSVLHLMPGVQKQTEEFGVPGKHYEVWLTEWNSVDFNPGPQTMGHINAMFVADYLGKLATVNIEQASYWDVHNSITEQGGDYGYLSRVGAPDGDNIPRPSYYAFKMASDALRGKLVDCGSDSYDVTCYATEKENGEKWVLLVNKMAETRANVSLKGFKGTVLRRELNHENTTKGWTETEEKLSGKIILPAHSITTLKIK